MLTQDDPKVTLTEKKIEYLCYVSSKHAGFLINNIEIFTIHIHTGKVEENLLLATVIDFNKKISPSYV